LSNNNTVCIRGCLCVMVLRSYNLRKSDYHTRHDPLLRLHLLYLPYLLYLLLSDSLFLQLPHKKLASLQLYLSFHPPAACPALNNTLFFLFFFLYDGPLAGLLSLDGYPRTFLSQHTLAFALHMLHRVGRSAVEQENMQGGKTPLQNAMGTRCDGHYAWL